MSALTSASFCLIVHFLLCSSEDQENIITDPGQNVTLPCKVPNNNNIIVVEWSRPGMDLKYVLLYRDDRFDPFNQHPSYVNRVDLKDKEMKDGDVSLILKNVTMEDRGTYECRVIQRETNRRKRSNLDTDPIKIINLEVGPSGKTEKLIGDAGDKDGNTGDGGNNDGNIRGHVVVVGVILLAVMVSVGFLINKRLNKKKSDLSVPPDEAAGEQML